jgi:signal transduction histidine kinase
VKSFILAHYLDCFNFIAKERIAKKDLPEKYIHAHLVSVLTTGILMWSYAIVACLTIKSPIPGIVGIVASTLHLISPFLYRKNNDYFFNSNLYIGSGIIHQMTFAFFTGGFDSNILIWLGLLPMLAGVNAGRKSAITWSVITSVCVLGFLILKLNGFIFPNEISTVGHLISQALILFGWIFISTTVIWVHVLLVEKNDEKLIKSREGTQNIVNILSHDISTPLSVIGIKLKDLLKTSLTVQQLKIISKLTKATDHLIQVTESVKELRLNELGKKEIKLTDINTREMILELKEVFSERLEQKNLKLNWSVASEVYSIHSSRSLLLNQILGNLLSNAIKFSEPGSEIRLRISKSDSFVKVILEDSGVGIPKDMRDNIFEANASHSSLGTKGEKGLGFGLPIVKNCVERLNGEITFDTRTSLEGPSGTRFTLMFPV